MENSSAGIWVVERGKSFLNNKRLPDWEIDNSIYFDIDCSTTNDLNAIRKFLIRIIRNYQSKILCLDCFDTNQNNKFFEQTRLVQKLVKKAMEVPDSHVEWNELYGEINSFIKSLESKDDINRRKMAVYAKLENFIKQNKDYENPYPHSFFSDFTRISFSSSFRRLQDKAQVFPLEKYDYARTRLTHTIEVAGIAMQLGNLCAQKLRYYDNNKKKEFAFLFEKCLNCSSLLHDLGNPPYGHFGEDTIKEFFLPTFWEDNSVVIYEEDGTRHYKLNNLTKGNLTNNQIQQMRDDFNFFDGNAQSLRVAAKTQQYKVGSSLELTAAVLGSIIKYPCNSTQGKDHQKFGHFYSENDIIQKLSCMGTYKGGIRNPLAMLLEAADDISYVTSDLDDAVKKKALSIESFQAELAAFEKQADIDGYSLSFCKNFNSYYKENVSREVSAPFEYTIQRMTNDLRNQLIIEVVSTFCEQSDAILNKGIYFLNKKDAKIDMLSSGTWLANNGAFHFNELLSCVPSTQLISWIKKNLFKKHIYKDISILRSELAGHHVISFLLRQFIDAVLSLDFRQNVNGEFLLSNPKLNNKKYFRNEKIFELISKNFVDNFKKETHGLDVNSFEHIYYRLRLVIDYVSGMTDCYALEICNTLKGL